MPREDLPTLNFSNPFHWKTFLAYIETLKGKGIHRIEITRYRNQRTLDQNAYLWGVVYPVIAKALADAEGHGTPDIIGCHLRLKDEFLRRPHVRRDTGEVTGAYTPSSADLDVAEFSAYIERCIAFARDELMVNVPPAGDYRNEPERKEA